MSPRSATSTRNNSTSPKRPPKASQELHRPPQVARGERRRRRPDRRARPLALPHRHRRAQRRQGRLRREAADAQDRRGPADRQGRARQQSHLPGRHAAALRHSTTCRPRRSTWTPASSARSRWPAPGGTATATTCARRPRSLATQPSNLDWAHFLGPLKWRDWDPQQYWNWRAYLDFGGGQVTDLFTHWIDVVHMFMGKDIPIAAQASGGVYHYKDGRTAPDTINVLLEYPHRVHRDLRGHAGARHHRRRHRILRHGGQALDRPRPLRVHARRRARRPARPW